MPELRLTDPLVIIDRQPDGTVRTYICRSPETHKYEHFALIVYDLVRHIAKAFKVSEDEVWDWVKRERAHPTTEITIPS